VRPFNYWSQRRSQFGVRNFSDVPRKSITAETKNQTILILTAL
jgi:hypothetical protein